MAESEADDTLGEDYEKVEGGIPNTEFTPEGVHVTSNTTYAQTVYNIDAHKVQVFTGGKTDTGQNIPWRFYNLHGKDVVLDDNYSSVKRVKGYKNGVCFGNRPFEVGSPMHIKITETFEGKYGRCRMGFTNKDPATLKGSGILQKGFEFAKSSDGFFIFEPSLDTCAYRGAVVYFTYLDGCVTFRSSKNGAIQTFPCPNVFPNDSDPLWAFIELRGPVKTVEVENNNFHEVCGSLATVEVNKASKGWWYTLGFEGGLVCFTETPTEHGKYAEFSLSEVYLNSAGHVRVGICKDNPDLIPQELLPDTIVKNSKYVTMEMSSDDAALGNVISLVPFERIICVVVNKKTIGFISLDREVNKTWPVVELFGNTKAVEFIAEFPGTEDMITSVTRVNAELQNPTIVHQLSSVASLWLQSQVLMNKLKVVADIIHSTLGETFNPARWNIFVSSVASAASYFGLDSYVQLAEIGEGPDTIRTEGPTLAQSVQDFVDNINIIKASIAQRQSTNSGNMKLKLLRSIADALPSFDVRMPSWYPSTPPPAPLLLNLSPLPPNPIDVQAWYKPVISKTLLDTANKIEAAFVYMDPIIRQVYESGI